MYCFHIRYNKHKFKFIKCSIFPVCIILYLCRAYDFNLNLKLYNKKTYRKQWFLFFFVVVAACI